MGGIVDKIFGGGGKKQSQKARADMQRFYDQGVALNKPFMDAGSGAMGAMGGMLGINGGPAQDAAFKNYMDSTGYNFLLDTGSKAITGNQAAKGLLGSGATAKALTQFGQNLASTKTAEYMGQLNNMAQIGANAAGNVMNQGGQVAQNMAGQRQAGAASQRDAWGSVFNLGLSLAGMSDERLKTPLEKVGELANGVGLYLYRYLSGGPLQWGVSAQEVAQLQPQALGPVSEDGFLSVNYAALRG